VFRFPSVETAPRRESRRPSQTLWSDDFSPGRQF